MGPAASFNHVSDGLRGPDATAATDWQYHAIRGGHPHNPLAIHLRNCVVR